MNISNIKRWQNAWRQWLPEWSRDYRIGKLGGDLTAGIIVTVMLIPQSLAYAMLAGLPPQVGLYASILPLVAYALFGTSMTLAVGPVAVASLMTAVALQPLATAGSPEYVMLAGQLALISGLMLFAFGMLRFGFLANLLSHPVISGFVSGSAIVIAISQAKYILGLQVPADGVAATLLALIHQLPKLNIATTLIGISTLAFLFFARKGLPAVFVSSGFKKSHADLAARLAPMVAVIASTLVVSQFDLANTAGVRVVGDVPQGLPSLAMVSLDLASIGALWQPALLISLVGFVESVSVAHSLATRHQQKINANRELLGLGAANLASAVSGGYPVTGGFSRSVVNFAAGANTPLAGVISACLMAVVIAGMTGLFYMLPHAVLAATIIVAVVSLIDFSTIADAWRFDRADAVTGAATMAGVIFLGVEAGIVLGIALSLAAIVWRSSQPHIAVVGRIAGTEHYRNVDRHAVEQQAGLLAVRVDENLYFGNAAAVEARIDKLLAARHDTRFLLLIMSAINRIDSTALGVLTELEKSLRTREIMLFLAEVKGPVMDRLAHTEFGQNVSGRVFMSTHDAFCALAKHEYGNSNQPS